MENIDRLIENNARWAESVWETDPEFFTRLARQQSPGYFWIGCSDSRVPANQMAIHSSIYRLDQGILTPLRKLVTKPDYIGG